VLLFAAKLGLLVGGSLPKLATAGWALLFQELGHFFGTMAIGMPIALLLGIKREAIGATFSVGHEPSLAIIGEKYGMQSPEGRGVLAEYIIGTILARRKDSHMSQLRIRFWQNPLLGDLISASR
jgi:hypothetical protein